MSSRDPSGFRSNYSRLDRLLHRLALQMTPVAEISFDIEQARYGSKDRGVDPDTQRHVFVCGLARAGTTVLMRRFHETGAFRSLTYRDMPFVLAPNLWRGLSRSSRREAVAGERPHGDRMQVDVDSPESLDEVFWRVFAGPDYILPDRLVPHTPDDDEIGKFRRYVATILATEPPEMRYLSKNNNNVLRLGAVRAAFPDALILIPFRDPMRQAASLRNQHTRFQAMQNDDSFVRAYMTWLGHHEFGGDHRPFRFRDGDMGRLGRYAPETVDYWIASWINTYGWLLDNAPDDAVFVCYEDLCQDPSVWPRLCTLAGVARPPASDGLFEMAARTGPETCDAELENAARDLYERLQHRSLEALANGHPA